MFQFGKCRHQQPNSGTALNSRRIQAFRQEGQLGGDYGSTAETNLPEMGEFPSLYYTLLAYAGALNCLKRGVAGETKT